MDTVIKTQSNENNMLILGAGMAGCIAGVLNPKAEIWEASSGSRTHQAVLRFRSDAVSLATGIPFKKVKVCKAIYCNGSQQSPSIALSNQYSKKVTGKVLSRSVNNLDSVDRWIAPDTFHEQLREMCSDRISYEQAFKDPSDAWRFDYAISTIPMPVLSSALRYKKPLEIESQSSNAIYVTRLGLSGVDVYQTIYYPGKETPVYRASIEGNILIIESMQPIEDIPGSYDYILDSFGLTCMYDQVAIDHPQKLGKLSPISEPQRKSFIHWATIEHKIYSLGRYALWKNILLDEVLDDANKIKKSITQCNYDNHKENML